MLGSLLVLLGSFIFLAIYFSPTVVARYRRVKHFGSIFVINLFLGLTFIGWVVALAMACSDLIDNGLDRYSNKENDKDRNRESDSKDNSQMSF